MRSPQAGYQAIERARRLGGAAVRARQSINALGDQTVNAEQRHEAFDTDDGDANETVELALRIDAERPGANDDNVGLRDTQRFDFDATAAACISRKRLGPRLGRQILKSAQYGLEFSVDWRCEQGIQCRRCRPRQVQGHLDHRIVAGRACRNAALQICMLGFEEAARHYPRRDRDANRQAPQKHSQDRAAPRARLSAHASSRRPQAAVGRFAKTRADP